ncbi:hypothetical protein CT0861_09121, partial [Colletotrichum tofieldiae]
LVGLGCCVLTRWRIRTGNDILQLKLRETQSSKLLERRWFDESRKKKLALAHFYDEHSTGRLAALKLTPEGGDLADLTRLLLARTVEFRERAR